MDSLGDRFDPIFSKHNCEKKLSDFERLVEKRIPSPLQDHYKEEDIQSNIGKFQHGKTFQQHSDMEELGAKLAHDVHLAAEEGFAKFPEALADPKEASAFMATLATVFVQRIHKELKKMHMDLADCDLLTPDEKTRKDDEEPGPS